jgi:hypothetical protein
MKQIRSMLNMKGTVTLWIAAPALALVLCLGSTGIALGDCPNSPLRCIWLDDKGETHTESTSIGQCADSWGGCRVANCSGNPCGSMYYTCSRVFRIPEDKVREANANGQDCRR